MFNSIDELLNHLHRYRVEDDDGEKGGSGSDKSDDKDDDAGKGKETGDGDKDKKDDGKKDDGDDAAALRDRADRAEAEANRLKREAAERDRKEREAKRKKDEEAGEFKGLYEREKERNADLEKRLNRIEQDKLVSKVAKRLKFRDPEDASRWLDDGDMEDERSVERALERVAREKDYLIKSTNRTGGNSDDDNERESERDNGGRERETARSGAGGGASEPVGFERLRGVKRKDT